MRTKCCLSRPGKEPCLSSHISFQHPDGARTTGAQFAAETVESLADAASHPAHSVSESESGFEHGSNSKVLCSFPLARQPAGALSLSDGGDRDAGVSEEECTA